MEGEGDLLKAVSLSLQVSHTLRELPRKTPPVHGKVFYVLQGGEGLRGSFVLGTGGGFLIVRLSRPVDERNAFRVLKRGAKAPCRKDFEDARATSHREVARADF